MLLLGLSLWLEEWRVAVLGLPEHWDRTWIIPEQFSPLQGTAGEEEAAQCPAPVPGQGGHYSPW